MRVHESSRRGLNRGAQVTVEFALVLPLLITILCACIDLSYLFFQDHTIHSAARLAARQAAVGATDATLDAFIKAYCAGFGITTSNITIKETDPSGTVVGATPASNETGGLRVPGNQVFVQVNHNILFFTLLSSVFQNFGVSNISASSQFICE